MTEATMTRDLDMAADDAAVEHGIIELPGAFTRQFRLLWQTRRPLILLVLMLGLLTLSGPPWNNDRFARLFIMWPLWLIFTGPVWAFAVWHDEGPSKRHYMWSQPVKRVTHTLARVLAGLAWLWLAHIILIATGTLFAATDGNLWQVAAFHAHGWLNWFTAPLLGYLAVSILGIASDYPLRWTAALVFGVPFLVSIMLEVFELEALLEWLAEPIANETWGLGVGLVGGILEAMARLEALVQDRLYDPSDGPGWPRWWIPALGWNVALAAVVAFVASRHPDTFPRLRRRG